MEIRRLKGSEYETGTDFLDLVFSSAYCPMRFREILPVVYRPDDEHMSCNLAVFNEGKIRAIVGLFPSDIDVCGEKLKLGGIGGVSVHNNDRSMGHMKALMGAAIDAMKSDGTDLSFLTGLRQRYEYFGYTKSGMLLRFKMNRDNFRHYFGSAPAPDLRLVPVGREDREYLASMKALYDAQPFHCVRSQEDFYLYIITMRAKPHAALRPDGSVAGYFVCDEKGSTINEIFAEDESVFIDMLRLWSSECPFMTMYLSPWQDDFARAAGQFAEEYALTDNGNWRIFNWDRVLSALLKVKNNVSPLPFGKLSIKIEDYGVVEMAVTPEGVSCKKSDAEPDVSFDSLTAMRVLLGHFPAMYATRLPMAAAELMNAWFPLPLSWLIQNYV